MFSGHLSNLFCHWVHTVYIILHSAFLRAFALCRTLTFLGLMERLTQSRSIVFKSQLHHRQAFSFPRPFTALAFRTAPVTSGSLLLAPAIFLPSWESLHHQPLFCTHLNSSVSVMFLCYILSLDQPTYPLV